MSVSFDSDFEDIISEFLSQQPIGSILCIQLRIEKEENIIANYLLQLLNILEMLKIIYLKYGALKHLSFLFSFVKQ